MEREIIQLEDDETALFNRVASICHHSLKVETEELFMRLFTLYGVEYVPFSDNAKYSIYMPFYRTEDKKKIGYVFTYSMMKRIDWKKIKETLTLVPRDIIPIHDNLVLLISVTPVYDYTDWGRDVSDNEID